MKIRTQRQLIQNVAQHWRRQYEPFKDDAPLFSWRTGQTSPPLSKQQIAVKLDALDGDTASAEDVSAIIGNESWTRFKCDECKADVTLTVQVGDEPDYESHTAELCLKCTEKAAALIRGMRVELPKGESPCTEGRKDNAGTHPLRAGDEQSQH
jgi:Zn finger protein HypA/HybF involved in hydrogenase expression